MSENLRPGNNLEPHSESLRAAGSIHDDRRVCVEYFKAIMIRGTFDRDVLDVSEKSTSWESGIG